MAAFYETVKYSLSSNFTTVLLTEFVLQRFQNFEVNFNGVVMAAALLQISKIKVDTDIDLAP